MFNFVKLRKKPIILAGIVIFLAASAAWLIISDSPETSVKEPVREVQTDESSGLLFSDDAEQTATDTTVISKPVLETLKPRLDGLGIEERNEAIPTGVTDEGERVGHRRLYQTENGDTLWELAGRSDSYDNSFRWPLLYLQNQQQIDHIIYDSSAKKWNAILPSPSALMIAPDPQRVGQPAESFSGNAYAVQLLSLSEKKRETAYAITRKLIESGYCAYLYRTRDKIYAPGLGKAIYFYRIRVGPFNTASEAMNAGEEIRFEMYDTGLFTEKYWVTRLSEMEKSGRQFDFGVHRRNPWVFQVSQNQNFQQALETFHTIEEGSGFAYIKMTSDEPYGKLYSVRVGFFKSQEAALKRFNSLQKQTGYQLEQYLPIELYDPFELIPASF